MTATLDPNCKFDPAIHVYVSNVDQVTTGELIYNTYVGPCVVISKDEKWIHVEYEGIPGNAPSITRLYTRADPVGFFGKDDKFNFYTEYAEDRLPYFWKLRSETCL